MGKEIDVVLLRKLIQYDQETGVLFWMPRPLSMFKDERSWKIWNTRYSGKETSTCKKEGYRVSTVLSSQMYAHRIAWALATGAWPVDEVDHVDGDRSNNRLNNLREADRLVQTKNRCMSGNNTSGVMGVCWDKLNKKWVAVATDKGKVHHLGRYRCLSAATIVRKAAESRLGFSKRHGEPTSIQQQGATS